jgi:AraC-like DNA-binding protein
MQLVRRRVERETIMVEAGSFVAREFRVPCFPFLWHYHPELELTLIVKGRGLRFVGDSVQAYRDGDLCLLGANLPHSWSSTPRRGERVHSVVVQFLPDFLGTDWLGSTEMRPIAALFERARRGLRITGKTAQETAERIRALRPMPATSPRRAVELLAILATLAESRHCEPLAVDQARPALTPAVHRRLSSALDAIHQEQGDAPRQADAASAAGMSPAAFSRFFRRQLGRPYERYVNDVRTARACRALMETDAPVTQIAYDAGFNNLSNFNRRFLAAKNMTPTQYRRLSRKSLAASKPSPEASKR